MSLRALGLPLSMALACSLMAGSGAHAAGFGIFEQGAKGMGMAGAFTAQADDGSAMFHNVAGLGFILEKRLDAGVTLIKLNESTFDGLDPFPGEGTFGEQDVELQTPVHAYYVRPIGDRMTFGLGVFTPFGLATAWDDKDNWAGRFLNLRAELLTFDVNPSIAYRVSDHFSIGLGLTGRFAEVSLLRRGPAINPFTQTVFDAASVKLESDLDNGFGWNVGVLHRYNNSFAWGLSYRSKIEVDFGGSGRLTQLPSGNQVLDAIVAGSLPFGRDLPIETSLEFPDMASLGVALALSANTLMEVDVNWTGWSSFDTLVIDFIDTPALTSVLPQNYEDAYNYRIGFRWTAPSQSRWSFGYVFDESPQPDESVGPLLPDSDRNGFTVGYGRSVGAWGYDVALMYLDFKERTTTTNHDNFFGTYKTDAWLLGVTATF